MVPVIFAPGGKALRIFPPDPRFSVAIPLYIRTAFFPINGMRLAIRKSYSEMQMTLLQSSTVNHEATQISALATMGRFSKKGQPCTVKIIFFTPAHRAATDPMPPALDEFRWTTSGFSFLKISTNCCRILTSFQIYPRYSFYP